MKNNIYRCSMCDAYVDSIHMLVIWKLANIILCADCYKLFAYNRRHCIGVYNR